MDHLPVEIVLQIFTFLPVADLIRVSLVSKRFWELAGDQQLLRLVQMPLVTSKVLWEYQNPFIKKGVIFYVQNFSRNSRLTCSLDFTGVHYFAIFSFLPSQWYLLFFNLCLVLIKFSTLVMLVGNSHWGQAGPGSVWQILRGWLGFYNSRIWIHHDRSSWILIYVICLCYKKQNVFEKYTWPLFIQTSVSWISDILDIIHWGDDGRVICVLVLHTENPGGMHDWILAATEMEFFCHCWRPPNLVSGLPLHWEAQRWAPEENSISQNKMAPL